MKQLITVLLGKGNQEVCRGDGGDRGGSDDLSWSRMSGRKAFQAERAAAHFVETKHQVSFGSCK